VLQVPFRLLKNFHKIQQRLVRELEKKFSGKDVVVVANRRIMPPPTSGKSNARPRSRTLTAVSERKGWGWGMALAAVVSGGCAMGRAA
jgi:small subunit ribosomal protein S7e